MGFLSDSLTRLFDNGERQALSLFNEAQRALDKFDFDSTIDSLMEGYNTLYDNFSDIMKNVKETVSDFTVTMPFNEKEETFKYNIEDNILTVKVSGEGTTRETSVTIPDSCITDKIKYVIDRNEGKLTVTIPKNVAKDEKILKLKNIVSSKAKETANKFKKAIEASRKEEAGQKKRVTKKPQGKVVFDGKKFVRKS